MGWGPAAVMRARIASAVPRVRVVLVAALLAPGCGGGGPPEPLPPGLSLSFVASSLLPPSTESESIAIGGISAMAHEEGGLWLALSDARVSSRFYEMEVSLESGNLTVRPRAPVPLENADHLDPEGMARTSGGTLLVSTEGDSRQALQPKLLEFDRGGKVLQTFAIPKKFRFHASPLPSGIRDNLGFESLAISPDGKTLYVGTEGSLGQDGPLAGVETVGFSRILVYAVEGRSLSPVREHVYPLGPFTPFPEFAEQEVAGGLVELVALEGGRLLALERIFIRETAGERRDRNEIRIFTVDLSAATDVSDVESLGERSDWRPATKELLLDLDDVVERLPAEYPRLDNVEAMGLGPELPGGGRMLLLASDDNFQAKQRTQFLLFGLTGL